VRPFPYSFAAALAVVAFAGCSRAHVEMAEAANVVRVSVRVAPVQQVVAPVFVETPGVVRATERATIAAKISGTIDTIPLTLGQVVKRGELLVRLSAPELAARLGQARAQLEQAEREEKRNRELAATGADTTDAAHAAAERLRGAVASVAEAEAMLAYTEIRAPYDGRVAQKLVYPGDLAMPGTPLLAFERSAALQVEVAVPASLALTLAIDAEIVVQISGLTKPVIARVAEIAAAADPATHTVLAKLNLVSPNPEWSGRAVGVLLRGDPVESLLVPAACVARFGQIERVFVVSDGKAQLRLVKTGAMHDDRIELLAGVDVGENIVVAPPGTLHDGQPVVVAP
jgi:RND family efflux transporter MFP subunit